MPTEPAEKKDLGKYVYQECVIVAIDKGRRKVKSFKSEEGHFNVCLLYTSPSPRDKRQSRMPSSA